MYHGFREEEKRLSRRIAIRQALAEAALAIMLALAMTGFVGLMVFAFAPAKSL